MKTIHSIIQMCAHIFVLMNSNICFKIAKKPERKREKATKKIEQVTERADGNSIPILVHARILINSSKFVYLFVSWRPFRIYVH